MSVSTKTAIGFIVGTLGSLITVKEKLITRPSGPIWKKWKG